MTISIWFEQWWAACRQPEMPVPAAGLSGWQAAAPHPGRGRHACSDTTSATSLQNMQHCLHILQTVAKLTVGCGRLAGRGAPGGRRRARLGMQVLGYQS